MTKYEPMECPQCGEITLDETANGEYTCGNCGHQEYDFKAIKEIEDEKDSRSE